MEEKEPYMMLITIEIDAKDNETATEQAQMIGRRLAQASERVDGWLLLDAAGNEVTEVSYAPTEQSPEGGQG